MCVSYTQYEIRHSFEQRISPFGPGKLFDCTNQTLPEGSSNATQESRDGYRSCPRRSNMRNTACRTKKSLRNNEEHNRMSKRYTAKKCHVQRLETQDKEHNSKMDDLMYLRFGKWYDDGDTDIY